MIPSVSLKNNLLGVYSADSDTSQYFTKFIPASLKQIISKHKTEFIYQIKGSVGRFKLAQIPWVAMLNIQITKSTKEGFYIVYLFSPFTNSFYLCLAFGWMQYQKRSGTSKNPDISFEILQKDITNLKTKYPKLFQISGFEFDKLDLMASSELAKGYEYSCFYHKQYHLNNLQNINDTELYKDIYALIHIYDQLAKDFIYEKLVLTK